MIKFTKIQFSFITIIIAHLAFSYFWIVLSHTIFNSLWNYERVQAVPTGTTFFYYRHYFYNYHRSPATISQCWNSIINKFHNSFKFPSYLKYLKHKSFSVEESFQKPLIALCWAIPSYSLNSVCLWGETTSSYPMAGTIHMLTSSLFFLLLSCSLHNHCSALYFSHDVAACCFIPFKHMSTLL